VKRTIVREARKGKIQHDTKGKTPSARVPNSLPEMKSKSETLGCGQKWNCGFMS
jgi:hypothetical protein